MNGEAKKEAVAERLEEIRLKNGGVLRPTDVVGAARDPKSVLHDEFEWDNSVAAERFRIDQARTLISSVSVTIVDETRVLQTVAYVRDPDAAPKEQGYVRTVDLRDDEAKAKETLLNEISRAAAYLARVRSLADALGLDDSAKEIEAKLGVLRERVEA